MLIIKSAERERGKTGEIDGVMSWRGEKGDGTETREQGSLSSSKQVGA